MVYLGPLAPCDPDTGRTPPCPTRHQSAVKVETVDGEHVGWLCPDCDGVLRPEWVSLEERNRRHVEAHETDHHGAPWMMVLGCPRCGEETTAANR